MNDEDRIAGLKKTLKDAQERIDSLTLWVNNRIKEVEAEREDLKVKLEEANHILMDIPFNSNPDSIIRGQRARIKELEKQLECDHDPVFHEMGFPVYNKACWVCSKCIKYMGDDYEGGPK